jgi:hypothetical protein
MFGPLAQPVSDTISAQTQNAASLALSANLINKDQFDRMTDGYVSNRDLDDAQAIADAQPNNGTATYLLHAIKQHIGEQAPETIEGQNMIDARTIPQHIAACADSAASELWRRVKSKVTGD